MKHWLWGTLVVLLAAAGWASAQSEAVPWTIEDAAGDVAYLVAEEAAIPAAAEGHGRADLLTLTITETDELLVFTYHVTDLQEYPPGSGQYLDAAGIDARFHFGELRYDVRTGIYQQGQVISELRRADGPGIESVIALLDYENDLAAGSFTLFVPRELIRDHNGAPAQRGMEFTELHVDSHVHATGVFLPTEDGTMQPLGIRDRLPDDGGETYVVQLGGPYTEGNIGLDVPLPFRASNGGEAAIAYELFIHNRGTSIGTYSVAVTDQPEAWTVSHGRSIIIPPGQRGVVDVFIQTPFGHQHGGFENFTVQITDTEDPANFGLAKMGIYYLDIPQPAGHHDTLFLHSLATSNLPLLPGGFLWMNTEPPADDGGPVRAPMSFDGSQTSFEWNLCLQPRLQLGIDVNMSKTGQLTLPMHSDTPAPGTLEAELVRLDPNDGCDAGVEQTVLAAIEPVAVDLASSPIIQVPLLPDAAGDHLPFVAQTDLVLRVRFTADPVASPAGGPVIQPGGSIILPFDEYFDERPAGVVGATAEEAPVLETPRIVGDSAGEEATSWPAFTVVAALAGLATARRRR